jgi:hypothetical protein
MTRSILAGSRPRAHLLTGLEADPEQAGEPRAEPPGGVVLAIGVESGVEQRLTLGMLDQEDRDRHGDVALAALHQTAELAGDRAACKGVELDRHRLPQTRCCDGIPRLTVFRAASIDRSSGLGNGGSGTHLKPTI